MINSAIVSVYDKSRLRVLLEGMRELNPEVEVFSSGGTAKRIEELGFEVTNISSYTGFPEAPGGLVKTLHPKVHGGILLDEGKTPEGMYLKDNDIKSFDLVVCNLYPFEETVESGGSKEEIVENIDIGGPTLIRSAAKGALRHGTVVPVIEPSDYGKIIDEMIENDGKLRRETINHLVKKAFRHTWKYEEKIKNWTQKHVEG